MEARYLAAQTLRAVATDGHRACLFEAGRDHRIEPGQHVGGMVTGGLSGTDVGKIEVIGGMALGSTLMPLLIHAFGIRWSLTALGVAVPVVVVAISPVVARPVMTLSAVPSLNRVAVFENAL